MTLAAAGGSGGFVKKDAVVTITVADTNTGKTGTGGSGNTSNVDTLDVTVTSTSDPTGLTVTLTESGAATNSFVSTFAVVDVTTGTSTSTSPKRIASSDGDSITVQYTDSSPDIGTAAIVSQTLTVDFTAPTLSGAVPTHDSAFKGSQFTVAFQVSGADSGSGFDATSAATLASHLTYTIGSATATASSASGDAAAVTGTLNVILGAGTTAWNVSVADRAGNAGTLDSDSATTGNQNYSFIIDGTAPVLASASTGLGLDADAAETTNSSGVKVVLTEADNLDTATVAAADFTVDGVVPASATVKAGSGTEAVYLVMGSALASDSKPTVKVVGTVNDRAGNTTAIAQVTATDGMKPGLTVSVTGDATDRAAAKSAITVRVVSDEALAAAPTVTAKLLSYDGTSVTESSTTGPTISIVPVSGATNTWDASFTSSAEGLYNIRVAGTDKASPANTTTSGQGASGAAITLASATLLEIDDEFNNGANPTFTLNPEIGSATPSETDSLSPFVRIDFAGEGAEFQVGTSSNASDSITQSGVATDIDSHARIELTVAKFGEDGTTLSDVLATVQRIDDDSFLLLASSLTVGKTYKVEVNGTDAVANTGAANFSTTFKVVSPTAFSVSIVPGWNLVSLPGLPTETAIDDVLGTATAIDQVLTYDPGDPVSGPWLVSERGADDKFTGTITAIDNLHGYWLHADSFVTLSVTIPRRTVSTASQHLLPPVVPIYADWSLVPVIDLSLSASGTEIDPDTYLATVGTWKFAYTWNTQTNAWVRILPAATPDNNSATLSDSVQVGRAYWVWSTAAGVLVP